MCQMRDTECQWKDARLIAAAPELLAACKVAMATLENYGTIAENARNEQRGMSYETSRTMSHNIPALVASMRAAIAKAEGGAA